MWEDEYLYAPLEDDFAGWEEEMGVPQQDDALALSAAGFDDWGDSSDSALGNETLENALAEERTLELESELEQDEYPETIMPRWRTWKRKPRPPVRSGSSGKFARRH